jgi:hypothetical protein
MVTSSTSLVPAGTTLLWRQTSGARAIEPTPEAQEAFVADVDRKMTGRVWTGGRTGCAPGGSTPPRTGRFPSVNHAR